MAKAFVFSGGGAFAVPELGIVKYLEEAQLFNPETDLAIGTSFGAIAAGSLVLKHEEGEMLRMLKRFDKVASNALSTSSLVLSAFRFPFTWGLASLIDILAPYFGGMEYLNKFPRSLIVCATDLVTFKPMYFNASVHMSEQITILESIAASASIPFVFQPVTYHESVFVDGGLVKNIPLSPAQKMDEVYVFGNRPEAYHANISSIESYFGAFLSGAVYRLNEEFTAKVENIDNFLGFTSKAKHVLDFSNFEVDFEEGYQKAKKYFERRN